VPAVTPLLLALLVTSAAPSPPPRDKLRFGLDYRWWGRNLQFQGAPQLSSVSAGPVPTGATFDIQWFPMSYFQDDWRADVGLVFRADIAPEFTLRAGETTLKAATARLRTGLMFRIPFEHVEPSVHLGFHAFEATTRPRSGNPRPSLPNSSLTGPRLGLGLRLLEFWRMTFDIGFGGTILVTTGELGSAAYFPGAKGNAFDGNIGLAFRTFPFLDLRLGVDLTVHSLALANGVTATDTYYGISFGLIFKGVPLPGN
jgi:hypothetical protein